MFLHRVASTVVVSELMSSLCTLPSFVVGGIFFQATAVFMLS